MALYRKKNSRFWYAEVYVRRTGKKVAFSTGKEDKAEALVVERAFRNAQERNLAPEKIHAIVDAIYDDKENKPAGIRLADAFARYEAALETAGRTTIRRTLLYKRTTVRRLVAWIEENNPASVYVSEVTRAIAGRFAADFNARADISDKTKREAISSLGTVWNVLMGVDDTIAENPWKYFRRTVSERGERLAFTPDEERRIFSASLGTEWHTASYIARYTGLRLGDVAGLTWGDIDLESGVLRLTPSKTKKHGIAVAIPLAERLHRLLVAKRRLAKGDAVLPCLSRSYPKTARLPFGSFSDILREAGVDAESHTFHSWRHTFRTRLSEAGVSDDLAKRLGGWTCDNTAMRYDHAERIEEMRAAVERASAKDDAQG